ncbi:glycerol-3-phosphate acyltransferase 2, mitochondrial [Pristis pectinata]|uniref:glycerol-3-phosphate acyltransferase 2, mitochondrial n=1 Tax=Pristis pectinata TaxID=685728 RepID=UPI00223E6FDA|nr:glycerol-3-phosphate acyltransferase 2, mitochondrial [Pristis pectinata]
MTLVFKHSRNFMWQPNRRAGPEGWPIRGLRGKTQVQSVRPGGLSSAIVLLASAVTRSQADTMALKQDKGDGFVPIKSIEFIKKVNYSGLLSSLPSGGVSLLLGNTRPFIGRCCYTCTPQSWGMLFHNYLTLLGFRNALLVTEKQTRYQGWLARRLCYILFVAERRVYPNVPFLEHKIISSARVQDAVKNIPDTNVSDQKSPCNLKNVVCILHQIQATISPLVLRMTSWVLLKVFNWVFINLQVHRGQIEMLRKAREKYDGPFIFFPVRKSRLDYLLVTFVLFCHSIRVPYITCGEDVRLPFLRTLLPRLGGIFTTLHGTRISPRKNLYKTVLNTYVEKLLNEQQSLLVYLEDPVQSCGRPCPTGLEWLARVVDAFHNRSISDAVLIPVGVSYDRIVEGNCYEQMDTSRTTVFAAICWMLRFLQKSYGCIRVDFGQPFSLKDYLENEGIHFRTSAIPLQRILLPCVLGYSSDSVYCEKSQDWLLNNEGWTQLSKRHQALVADLGKHVLYTATCCSAVMSTTLVACLLLHKHQQGVFLTTLAKDFCWLMNKVLARHFDVGFSGKLQDIMLHALSLLRDCVMFRSFSLTNLIVIPKTTKEAVKQLSFYSNAILPVFICEAVAACALSSLLREVARHVTDWDSNVEVVISQEELICKTVQLCHLLPSEVLLLPPCQSVYQFSQEAVDKLTYCEILIVEENENSQTTCDTWRKRFAKELTWKVLDDFDDSDSDCEGTLKCYFKLGQTAESHTFFILLCSLLQPVLKAYEMVAGLLHKFDFPMEEPQCVLKMFKFLQAQVEEHPGSATLYLANSAVRTFKELGMLHSGIIHFPVNLVNWEPSACKESVGTETWFSKWRRE